MDEARCPVCPLKHSHATPAPDSPGAAAGSGAAGDGPAGMPLPLPPQPSSLLLAAAAANSFRDFTPHLKTPGHLEAARQFQECRAWVTGLAAPRLAEAQVVMSQLEAAAQEMRESSCGPPLCRAACCLLIWC